MRQFDPAALRNIGQWPLVAPISAIDLRFDDELSETWYNSIFCGLFSHDLISDGCMFIHRGQACAGRRRRKPVSTRRPVKIADMLAQVFSDYSFSEPYADLPAGAASKPSCGKTCQIGCARTQTSKSSCFPSVLYRNKGAYLVGRIYTRDEQWPLVIPLLHREGVASRSTR